MLETLDHVPSTLPPHVQLIQMAGASWISATVYAAAKIGIADHLAGGPKSAAELAGVTQTHAPSLHRLMRTLAGLGILTERESQRFALTPLGEALTTGAPGSARATLIAFCGPAFWHSWEEMVYSLQTGKTGFEKACGLPLFEYLAQHPDEASYFSEAMVGFHGSEPPAVAEAYDFAGITPFSAALTNALPAWMTHVPPSQTPPWNQPSRPASTNPRPTAWPRRAARAGRSSVPPGPSRRTGPSPWRPSRRR